MNEDKVRNNLYGKDKKVKSVSKTKLVKTKFKLQDRVRITKKKLFFEKGYTPKWTNEIFVISEIHYTDPVTYKIKDLNEEEIIGSFYDKELQRTKF